MGETEIMYLLNVSFSILSFLHDSQTRNIYKDTNLSCKLIVFLQSSEVLNIQLTTKSPRDANKNSTLHYSACSLSLVSFWDLDLNIYTWTEQETWFIDAVTTYGNPWPVFLAFITCHHEPLITEQIETWRKLNTQMNNKKKINHF